MFLQRFLLVIILTFVVQAQCEESQEVPLKQETIVESVNETKAEEYVGLSTAGNLVITLPLNGSESTQTTVVYTDLSTAALLNETENNPGEVDDLKVATTALNIDDDISSTNNATDTTEVEGVTETTTQYLPAITTEPFNETFTEDLTGTTSDLFNDTITMEATENITNSTDETTDTDESTINTTELTVKEIVTESTTTTELPTTTESTTTTEVPTTPVDILCPQIPDTDFDPKYRNTTFDLHLEEFMKKNPTARIYKSPGFPAPYAENLNCTLSVTLSNCTGVDIVVHYLDVNPFVHDSLYIRGGEENALDEKGKELTGREFGVAFKIIHSTSLYIWFKSGYHDDTGEYRGFLLTYSPYGNDTLPPTTTEAPITIPPSRVQIYEVQLVVPESSKTNETWQKVKDVLASSASSYVTDQNFNYELAVPDNVSLTVLNCPKNWPDYENCVRIQFSISLWNLNYDPEIHYDLSIFEYELSTNSLSVMWDLYGRDDFLDILGIEEYSIPDGTYILLLWTGISLTIVVIFIGVLYSIWRIDIFREYRRMHTRSDDQQDILKTKSELDISMYPIPHQPYPTLFETAEINSGGYYDSHEINSTSFQSHSFQEKPSTNYRHATTNPFTPNIVDFNDTQLFPDDEDDFGRVQSLSPRSKHKLLVLGAKRDESNT